MATTLTFSPLGIDCGVNAVGVASATQTVTLTATGGTVAVSALTMSNADFALVSPPSLPFNVTTTQALVIQFTPSTLGAEPGTLTVTSNAGTGGSLVIPLVGIGGYPYTQYTLPPILNRPIGQINCYMFIDSSIAAVTVPTKVRFLDIGKVVEKIDAEAGTTDISNVDITLAEDYTVYPEGFFYKLIVENPNANIDFMFTVMNGANEEFYFRGTVYRQGGVVPELYLDNVSSPGSWVRGVKVQLVSALITLQNSTMGDLSAIVGAHFFPMQCDSSLFPTYNFVTLKTVFASMMELAFIGAYDESLVIDNGDFSSLPNGVQTTSSISWINFSITLSWFQAASSGSPSQPNPYYSQYATPWDLLKQLCAQFGVIPRYTFGNSSGYIDSTPSNNKHRITFNTRGKSGNSITMVGNVISSSINQMTSRIVSRLSVTSNVVLPSYECWYWDGNLDLIDQAEPWRTFDKNIGADFTGLGGAWDYAYFYQQNSSIARMEPILNFQYWNYHTGAIADTSGVNINYTDPFMAAIASYFYNRYGTIWMEYDRVYGSLLSNNGSSNSQMWTQTLQQSTISDGITSRSFFAAEIQKDILGNNVEIIWVCQGTTGVFFNRPRSSH